MSIEIKHLEIQNAFATCELGLRNQQLIANCLDIGLMHEAKSLQQVDTELLALWKEIKQQIGNALHINAKVGYSFRDTFTDPLDIRERNNGTSDPSARQANELIASEVGGQFYDIYDSWSTKLRAVIHVDASKSGDR